MTQSTRFYRRLPAFGVMLLAAACCLAPAAVWAQEADTVVATSFEAADGYAEGTLSGQDDWSVSAGEAQVVEDADYTHSGARGVQLMTDGSPLLANQTRYGESEAGPGGTVYFDFYVNVRSLAGNALTLLGYDLYGGSQKRAFIVDFTEPSGGTGNVRIYDSWHKTPLGDYTVGEWHRISGKVNYDEALYQVSLDGGAPVTVEFRADYTPPEGNRGYHQLRFNFGENQKQGTVDAAFDDLYVGRVAPDGVPFTSMAEEFPVHVIQPSAGTVTLDPSGTELREGTEVTATLEPDDGFVGCGWLGVEGEGLTTTFTVEGSLLLGAKTCVDENAEPPQERVVPVSSIEELKEALSDARPGDVIEMADGTYAEAGYVSISRGGVEGYPAPHAVASRLPAAATSPSIRRPTS